VIKIVALCLLIVILLLAIEGEDPLMRPAPKKEE